MASKINSEINGAIIPQFIANFKLTLPMSHMNLPVYKSNEHGINYGACKLHICYCLSRI